MSDATRRMLAVSVLCWATCLASSLSLAQSSFAVNYDVVLTVADAQYRAQSRVRVLDGATIPVEFDRFKVNLDVSSRDSDKFQALIAIHERIDGEWIELDVDAGGFGGRLGAPHRFAWDGDSMRLNIAVIISFDRQ